MSGARGNLEYFSVEANSRFADIHFDGIYVFVK